MKKTLIITALLVLGSLTAYSQGTVNFSDGDSDMTIHIFTPQLATPSVEVTGDTTGDIYYNNGADGNYAGTSVANTGNSSTTTSGGATVYTGGLLGATATSAGAYNYNVAGDYSVELYAAPGLNVAFSALQPVTQYLTTMATTTQKAGQFKGLAPSPDPGIPNTSGGQATIALVAWYNGGGATSYAAALAAGVPTGASPTDNMVSLGDLGTPSSQPIDMQGLESFSLVVPPVASPEPSTIALGVIGASTLLFRRRKQ